MRFPLGMGGVQRKQHLHVSFNHPYLKLQLSTNDPGSLREVRRIVEALGEPCTVAIEEGSLAEFRSRLSKEFFEHPELLARVQNAAVRDEEVRIAKRTIPFERELDLDNARETRQVNVLDVKSRVSEMFDWPGAVRECLVHIRGALTREEQCVIMDAVKQRLGLDAHPRFFSTPRDLEGAVLLEAVCFGEGIAERW
jgi:hypothetical protein